MATFKLATFSSESDVHGDSSVCNGDYGRFWSKTPERAGGRFPDSGELQVRVERPGRPEQLSLEGLIRLWHCQSNWGRFKSPGSVSNQDSSFHGLGKAWTQ